MPSAPNEFCVEASAEPKGSLARHVQEWQAEHLPALASAESRKEYKRMFDKVIECLGEFDTNEVRPGDVLTFLANWSDKPTARRAYKARLSTFFAWAVIHEYAQFNRKRPVSTVPTTVW